MPWKLTIRDLNVTVDEDELGEAVIGIATLLEGRGHQGFTFSLRRVLGPDDVPVRRNTSVHACSECGAPDELHALSCSRYSGPWGDPETPQPLEQLNEFVIQDLQGLPPYEWRSDSSDQAQPMVEIRQEHLAALLAEVLEGRMGP